MEADEVQRNIPSSTPSGPAPHPNSSTTSTKKAPAAPSASGPRSPTTSSKA
ncbi:hypothetical protein ACFQ3Z_44495 [Streptomyces nogalater]